MGAALAFGSCFSALGEGKSLIFTAVFSGKEIMLEHLLKVELVVIHFFNHGFRHIDHVSEFALIFYYHVV